MKSQDLYKAQIMVFAIACIAISIGLAVYGKQPSNYTCLYMIIWAIFLKGKP